MTRPVTPERLRTLFRPETIAVVGASDSSFYSQTAFEHLRHFGLTERTFLVNPRSKEVHGQRTFPSIKDIGHPVDVAFLMVPAARTEAALVEAAEAGVRNAVVLSSGYAEAGAAGRQAQESLLNTATALDMVVLGPNHLGFVNFVDGVPVTAVPFENIKAGPVALLSQSGASARGMLTFATRASVGLSYAVTLGNEAMITAADVLDYLVDDEGTRAVAIFLEEIRDPPTFERAARRAMHAGKAVVVLKTGSSELSARTAAAHTGALVGDDRVIDAVFRTLGVIRVDTIEDLIVTAGLAAHVGRLERPGVGVVSISGGACNIIADRAEEFDVELPALAGDTVRTLTEVMPDYGTVQNPLDVTGASVRDPTIFRRAIEAMGADPNVGVVAVINPLPEGQERAERPGQSRIDAIGEGMRSINVPSVYVNQVLVPIEGSASFALDTAGIGWAMAGLRQLVLGLGGVSWWSSVVARRTEAEEAPLVLDLSLLPRSEDRRGAWSEWQARELLQAAGVVMVPSEIVRSADDAVAAAERMGGPVAMKIVSPDILHKSDIGGVRLDVAGEAAVRTAFAATSQAGASVPDSRIEGVAVSPMRREGTELLVGVVRDPQWGLVLAVALGGLFVEVLQDSVLAPLPVTRVQAEEMLSSLRGRAVLQGVRGRPPADLAAIASTIERVSSLALALGEDLESLEINPLLVSGDRVEALDALVTWRRP